MTRLIFMLPRTVIPPRR